jgi:predicted GH43/DUF377 family glycosyl hydrolase
MFTVYKSPKNPFLSPSRTRPWEAIGSFNPSVVEKDAIHHFFYRAMSEPDPIRTPGRGFSTIGYTTSKDPDRVTQDRTQVITPTEAWDEFGCEDPRASFFEGKWYVFYTALGGFPFNADNIRTAVAIGDAPDNLTEKHMLAPFNAKASTLFPERINGEVVLLITAFTDWTPDHPRPIIAIARSKNIEDFWSKEFWDEWSKDIDSHAFPDVRRSDSEHIEVGATPILTTNGWMLIYSHIQNYYDDRNRIFGIEALLLDAKDPTTVLAKTEFPFIVPEEYYERYGHVANIVFPSGACIENDVLTVYYGGADTVGAFATLSLSHLLENMHKESRDNFLTRMTTEPILSPIPEHVWESGGVSNAAALDIGGSVHLVYRAVDHDNHSTLGYARLKDGIHVDERLPDPIYAPRDDFESHGTEDPRLTLIKDTIYLAYTGFNGSIARCVVSSISTSDFTQQNFNWASGKPVTPDSINDKDFVVLWADDESTTYMHRIDPTICVDTVPGAPGVDLICSFTQLMGPRPGMWDGVKVGAAGGPMKVPEGWLFIYHGVGPDFLYRLGAALLDDTCSKVLARTNAPILEPVLIWEKEGLVHNVVFSCGMVLRDETLYIYYGGADTYIGVATIALSTLMNHLGDGVY